MPCAKKNITLTFVAPPTNEMLLKKCYVELPKISLVLPKMVAAVTHKTKTFSGQRKFSKSQKHKEYC
jgi:hypothetical protein